MGCQPSTQRLARDLPYSTATPLPSSPTCIGSSIVKSLRLEGLFKTENPASHRTGKKLTVRSRCQVTSIDILPDDVLLEIFDFCAPGDLCDNYSKEGIEAWWQTLVHVCRRWRAVVFGSPRRLNVQLVYAPEAPTRNLDVWPALPLVISDGPNMSKLRGTDNVDVAVLEHSNRVCRIELGSGSSPMEKVLAAMQVPFPELTSLTLWSEGETIALPDSFLGGSAPRLEYLLNAIPFPGLPKLLLSATHLVDLHLFDISHSGYISPEAMLTALSVVPRLASLSLRFESDSPRSLPDKARRPRPPPERTILLVLTNIFFMGVSEYLEDLVAGIDAPQLSDLFITFFNDIVFDTPQLARFIRGTPLKSLERAYVSFGDRAARVRLSSQTSDHQCLVVDIPCSGLDQQFLSVEQVCTSSLSALPTLEDLHIFKVLWEDSTDNMQANIEDRLWLKLLRPSPAVKNLYLSVEFARRIEPALQEFAARRTTKVLPALQNLFLEELQPWGPVQEGIRQFVAMRQLASPPIVVSGWDMDRTRLY